MAYGSDVASFFSRLSGCGGLGRFRQFAAQLIRVLPIAIGMFAAHNAAAQRSAESPETATGSQTITSAARAPNGMISTASRLASEAGREMLTKGGSAVDAAIAAQLVLGLVEPQSSGLGGGAFILHWDQHAGKLTSYDGRETAPASATLDHFIRDGKPVPFSAAVQSGLSIGVPGLLRVMEMAHKRHGKLPWADLFQPALRLANDGFTVTPRLSLLLRWIGQEAFDGNARQYFFPGGRQVTAGATLKNPAYADTLHRLAEGGADAFYSGPLAEALVKAARDAPNFASGMTLADLASYAAKERDPVCITYRTRRVCGMGPPSSGGVTVAQTLKLLEGFDIGSGRAAAMSNQAIHLIAEAEKLAYADRNAFLGDPDFVAVPAGLLDDTYLAERRRLINPDAAMDNAAPGVPPGAAQRAFGVDATIERAGTSHLSIIDAEGNAVAMTTTIEGAFGSGVFVNGFLLNNQLTDFSFRAADAAGVPIANRVEAGKRPRSSMAPTIVFGADGRVYAVVGSPGGTRIILYVVKSLVALLDWQYDAQEAAALVNFGSQGKSFEIEIGWSGVGPALSMLGYGHDVDWGLLNSGTHIVVRRDTYLEGGADPRREGAALGH